MKRKAAMEVNIKWMMTMIPTGGRCNGNIEAILQQGRGLEGRVVLALPSNSVGLERVKGIGQSRTEECNLHRWGVTGGKKG